MFSSAQITMAILAQREHLKLSLDQAGMLAILAQMLPSGSYKVTKSSKEIAAGSSIDIVDRRIKDLRSRGLITFKVTKSKLGNGPREIDLSPVIEKLRLRKKDETTVQSIKKTQEKPPMAPVTTPLIQECYDHFKKNVEEAFPDTLLDTVPNKREASALTGALNSRKEADVKDVLELISKGKPGIDNIFYISKGKQVPSTLPNIIQIEKSMGTFIRMLPAWRKVGHIWWANKNNKVDSDDPFAKSPLDGYDSELQILGLA